jgi:hypothetical protein
MTIRSRREMTTLSSRTMPFRLIRPREKAARVAPSGLVDPTLGYPARGPASWHRRSEFLTLIHGRSHLKPGLMQGVQTRLAAALRVEGSLRSPFASLYQVKMRSLHGICALFVAELPRSVLNYIKRCNGRYGNSLQGGLQGLLQGQRASSVTESKAGRAGSHLVVISPSAGVMVSESPPMIEVCGREWFHGTISRTVLNHPSSLPAKIRSPVSCPTGLTHIRHAADQLYSISSSARCYSCTGTSRPSVFAVLRLMASEALRSSGIGWMLEGDPAGRACAVSFWHRGKSSP